MFDWEVSHGNRWMSCPAQLHAWSKDTGCLMLDKEKNDKKPNDQEH